MENPEEFERWLDQMLKDAKGKLQMTDETIAYILLREGNAHYLKTIGQCGRCGHRLTVARHRTSPQVEA